MEVFDQGIRMQTQVNLDFLVFDVPAMEKVVATEVNLVKNLMEQVVMAYENNRVEEIVAGVLIVD